MSHKTKNKKTPPTNTAETTTKNSHGGYQELLIEDKVNFY
jgi:hypothetical protein